MIEVGVTICLVGLKEREVNMQITKIKKRIKMIIEVRDIKYVIREESWCKMRG